MHSALLQNRPQRSPRSPGGIVWNDGLYPPKKTMGAKPGGKPLKQAGCFLHFGRFVWWLIPVIRRMTGTTSRNAVRIGGFSVRQRAIMAAEAVQCADCETHQRAGQKSGDGVDREGVHGGSSSGNGLFGLVW